MFTLQPEIETRGLRSCEVGNRRWIIGVSVSLMGGYSVSASLVYGEYNALSAGQSPWISPLPLNAAEDELLECQPTTAN